MSDRDLRAATEDVYSASEGWMMTNIIETTGKDLRDVTGWDEIGFVLDSDAVYVHTESVTGPYVLWADAHGVAQNLGTLTPRQALALDPRASRMRVGVRVRTTEDTGRIQQIGGARPDTGETLADDVAWVAWDSGVQTPCELATLELEEDNDAPVRMSLSDALYWARDTEAGDYLIEYEDSGLSDEEDPGSRCGFDDRELAEIERVLGERGLKLVADDCGLAAAEVV